MRLASVHVHPLKGGAIMDVPAAEIGRVGLAGDRRWMAIDPGNRFLSQRELPALATIRAEPSGERGLRLARADATTVAQATDDRVDALIWRSTVSLALARAEDHEWLSDELGRAVRLVHFDAGSERGTNGLFAPDGRVALADGYPVLVTTRASLDALNDDVLAAGGSPVPMQRFRPNLVIEGAVAWEEDSWHRIAVGDVEVDLVKPCDRCTVTTVDQVEGRLDGAEPLDTLRRTRRSGDPRVPGVLFGWNAVARGSGTVRAGAEVGVLARRAPWPIGRMRERHALPF